MKRILVVALALVPLGCSFYYSSESSWKTSTSPCRSSGSSKDEDKKEAYRDDVRDFTATYAAAHDDLGGFERGLATVARRHGITDWEADDTTFTAIGAGLKRADVHAADLPRYESLVAGDEPAKRALIRGGYGS